MKPNKAAMMMLGLAAAIGTTPAASPVIQARTVAQSQSSNTKQAIPRRAVQAEMYQQMMATGSIPDDAYGGSFRTKNQRQIRLMRRRKWAHGDKNAFHSQP